MRQLLVVLVSLAVHSTAMAAEIPEIRLRAETSAVYEFAGLDATYNSATLGLFAGPRLLIPLSRKVPVSLTLQPEFAARALWKKSFVGLSSRVGIECPWLSYELSAQTLGPTFGFAHSLDVRLRDVAFGVHIGALGHVDERGASWSIAGGHVSWRINVARESDAVVKTRRVRRHQWRRPEAEPLPVRDSGDRTDPR